MQDVRVILVGARPGEHRVRYALLVLGLLAVWGSAGTTLYGILRRLVRRQESPPASTAQD